MERIRKITPVAVFAAAALMILGANAQAQKLDTKEIKDNIRILSGRIVDFQNRLGYQLESSSADRRSSNQVMTDLQEMKDHIRMFDMAVSVRRDNRDGIEDILVAARNVDAFMAANRQYSGLERDWAGIRTQVERLSSHYGVNPNWDTGNNAPAPVTVSQVHDRGQGSRLSGTYRIDLSRSESIADALPRSQISAAQRRELEEKLEAPDTLSLNVSGDQVTMSSSKGSQVTFVADGSERTENANGMTVRVRSTLRGDKLSIASLGGETDYVITFEPQDAGRTLKVTRRITTNYLRDTIFSESFYTRSDSFAGNTNVDDNSGYSSNDPNDRGYNRPQYPTGSSTGVQGPVLGKPRLGDFIVPNGTTVDALLETPIDSKSSQNGDRFRMTVQSPNDFRGAVVEGYLTNIDRSNRVWGRSNVTFNFDRITLSDGKEYDFSGTLQRVVDQNGKIVAVDNEGIAQGKNKSRDTARRGGIGAGIGAIIGAIAGGGSGAALGAIIGGGVGAGSVAIEGQGDIKLGKGSTITVLSSSPIR